MLVKPNETAQFLPTLDDATVNSLVEMVNFVQSARDATSDEMVARLADTLSEGMALLDRLTHNEGLMRLLQVLDHPDSQQLLIGLSEALRATSRDIAAMPPAKGGLGELVHVTRQPGTQEGIRVLAVLGQHLSHSLREQHRKGG
jgi:uncharacterized protein YjgD (DUF1641 family)